MLGEGPPRQRGVGCRRTSSSSPFSPSTSATSPSPTTSSSAISSSSALQADAQERAAQVRPQGKRADYTGARQGQQRAARVARADWRRLTARVALAKASGGVAAHGLPARRGEYNAVVGAC